MEEIFSFSRIAFSCVYSVAIACMYAAGAKPVVGALQQCGYSGRRFFKWYFKKENMNRERITLFSLLALFSAAFMGMCFSFSEEKLLPEILSVAMIFFFSIAFLACGEKYALKVKTVMTARLKRLYILFVLLLAIFNYLCITLLNVAAYYIADSFVYCVIYSLLALYIPLVPYTLTFASVVISPFERAHLKGLVKKAEQTLKRSDAIKIGITGSFGKTSVKNILKTILSEKFSVFSTPASYNTPAGIAKCVNESFPEGTEIFIAEMGARRQGDISELCDMVKPTYGILTGVCAQHIETFGSINSVREEKKKLLDSAELSIYPPCALDEKAPSSLVRYGDKTLEIKNVECSSLGTSFVLAVEGKDYAFKTKLLSSHSALNIALCVAAALLSGMSMEEISLGISKIDFVEHRLSVIKANGVTILDDGYNANIVGARDAVDTLKLFDGKKFIVTPGIVELGVLEKACNAEFGKYLVGLDRIILVGDTLVTAVKKGYIEGGGEEEKIAVVSSLDKAKELLNSELSSGDAVLFLNDLPDVY